MCMNFNYQFIYTSIMHDKEGCGPWKQYQVYFLRVNKFMVGILGAWNCNNRIFNHNYYFKRVYDPGSAIKIKEDATRSATSLRGEVAP